MKKNEIKVKGLYRAKVSGNLVTVRVDSIRQRYNSLTKKETTVYDVTNLTTKRKTTFLSAMRFRMAVGLGDRVTMTGRKVSDNPVVQNIPVKAKAKPKMVVVDEIVAEEPLAKTCGDRQATLADKLRQRKDTGVDKAPHVIVEARAGTGKTTTLVEGLKLLRGFDTVLKPSPQQQAVWDAIGLSKDRANSVCFVAFNKDIAAELKRRVPQGCDAMTMHGMGFRAVARRFEQGGRRLEVNDRRVDSIIAELMDMPLKDLRWKEPLLLKAAVQLVSLCKINLVCPADASLDELAAYYDVDCNGDRLRVYDLVARVLEQCKRVDLDNTIDYDDMIWLPVALGLNTYIYDLLLVDEAQDLSRCQQALAKKCGRRLILCGDPKQAIYGFAGADAESMPRMERELAATERGCIHLPLTVTRRCGKAIVAAAQRYVPDFEAHESNSAGTVSNNTLVGYRTKVADGDMVLCRTNGPLVSECFKFLAQDRKATIQGRNIGKGLITTVERLKATTIIELIDKLAAWEEVERAKEEAEKNPSEVKLQNITDKVDCLHAFINSGDIKSVNDLITKTNSIFTDNADVQGIRLSSIHKAKGLEAERVFFINNENAPCPHPMAKTAWAREQESNLLYVGITRARAELVFVA